MATAPEGWKGYNGVSYDDASWYYSYADAIKNTTNDVSQLGRFKDIVKRYGLKDYSTQDNVSEDALRKMSINALGGDVNAQNYLKAMGYQMDKSKLWQGFSDKDFWDDTSRGSALRGAYMKDNPFGQFTKDYEYSFYNKNYKDMIVNNKPMEQWQKEWYQNVINKWGLDDFNDPYVQAIDQLKQDKQGALDAQDTALNQGMAQMDANSFQQFQQLQQGMAQRGMTDSGISADAYMRAQMANNQNYQQAYADGALKKSELSSKYNDAISQAKLGQMDYKAKLEQAMADQNIKLQEIQNDRDKWLTESTGEVYINGQRITMDGKPIKTLEWEKLSEQQRHNMVTEALTQQKNSWDYELGADSNAIRRQQIGVDLQIALGKMQIDREQLGYNYVKLEQDNKLAQEKLKLASESAQTSADKAKISSLSTQLNSLTSRITAYQKSNTKVPAELISQYNDVVGQLQAMAGNF